METPPPGSTLNRVRRRRARAAMEAPPPGSTLNRVRRRRERLPPPGSTLNRVRRRREAARSRSPSPSSSESDGGGPPPPPPPPPAGAAPNNPRLTFQNETFACKLRCDRCTYFKPNNQRCKNRVCYGYPTCWQHTIAHWGVRRRPSTTPGNGDGLFTTLDRNTGDWICPYLGEMISFNCFDQRYPGVTNAPYAVDNGGDVIDAACQRGIAASSNTLFDAAGHQRPRNEHNADIGRHNLQPWIRATSNIQAGEEIFVYGGAGYNAANNRNGGTTKRTKAQESRPC